MTRASSAESAQTFAVMMVVLVVVVVRRCDPRSDERKSGESNFLARNYHVIFLNA